MLQPVNKSGQLLPCEFDNLDFEVELYLCLSIQIGPL